MRDARQCSFQRVGNALVPSDPFAEEWIAAVKPGSHVLVSATRPRNVRHHRKLWALLRTAVETSGKWANADVLLREVKVATGCFSVQINSLTGLPYVVPDSISFASMDQVSFQAFYEKALNVLAGELGVSPEALDAQAHAAAA